MRDRTFQALGLAGWTIGVPAFAAGMAFVLIHAHRSTPPATIGAN